MVDISACELIVLWDIVSPVDSALICSLLKLTIPNWVTLANCDCPICAVLLSCSQRLLNYLASQSVGGRRGRDRMVVGLMTTYVISAYHH